jgi:hypothetical protein
MSRTEREREAHRVAEGRRWNRALAHRARYWTEEDHAEEATRLEAEKEAFLAAGQVTTFPVMWAARATQSSLFDM